MYQCPLCSVPSSNYVYATLDLLESHIDNVHCTITKSNRRLADEIGTLKNQLENLVDSSLKQLDERHVNERRARSAQIQTHDTKSVVSSEVPNFSRRSDRVSLIPSDYEYVKMENEYLKHRLRELERNWRRDVEVMEEKNRNSQHTTRNLTNFLKDTQQKQIRSKRGMQRFLDDMLLDLEQKEKIIDQLNREIHEKEEETTVPTELNYFPNRSHVSEVSPVDMQKTFSVRKRHPSGQSVDSGFHDGLDSSLRRRPHSANFENKSFPTNVQQVVVDVHSFPDIKKEMVTSRALRKDHSDSESVLNRVFQYLDTWTLLKAATICRKWKKVADNPAFMRRISLANVDISSQQLIKLATSCSQTFSITLRNVKALEYPPHSKKGILENGIQEVFKFCAQNLIFLKIVDCCPYLTDRCLWLASCHCLSLKQVVYVSAEFPVSAPVVWSIGASCREIDSFVVPISKFYKSSLKSSGDVIKFDDNCLLMIARCWPKSLKILCISGYHISITGLALIAEYCRNLEKFELEHYEGFTMSNAEMLCKKGLNRLRILNFVQTIISADAILYLCDNLPLLESLLVVTSENIIGDEYFKELMHVQDKKKSDAKLNRILHIVFQQ